MAVIPSVFAYEVSRRICGSHVIADALFEVLQYLTRHMPGNTLMLGRYAPDLGAFHLLVRADADQHLWLHEVTPIPQQAGAQLETAGAGLQLSEPATVELINRPAQHPVFSLMARYRNRPESSLLQMLLVLEDDVIGSLLLWADGLDQYQEMHAKLLAPLHQSFAMALSSAIKGWELIRLRDSLADDRLRAPTDRRVEGPRRGGPLRLDDVLPGDPPGPGPEIAPEDPGLLPFDDLLRQHIRRVLASCNGKIHGPGGAAELLGVNANTLRNRMTRLGIAFGRRPRQP